jgi:hypothetical protein
MAVTTDVGAPVKTLFWLCLNLLLISAASANTVTVVISGLGGNADYEEQFTQYATQIADEARRAAASPQDVILVRGDAAKRNVIISLLENLPVSNEAETFVMYLIGHGSTDNQQYKFNIPGPDITGTELADALANIKAPRQLIVVSTSASGALQETLAAPNRVVVTATKNARERNAVRFTEYLVNALSDAGADINKNESISAREMFDYAKSATENFYKQENLLAPEHAVLSGELADNIEVARYGVLLEKKDDIAPALLARRQSLAGEIDALKARKDDVDEDQYFDTLQQLMLELAEVQRDIDAGGAANAN